MAQPSTQQTHAQQPRLFTGRAGTDRFSMTCTDVAAWAWLQSDRPPPPRDHPATAAEMGR